MRIAVFHEVQRGGARVAINEFSRYLGRHHRVDLYTTEKLSKEEKSNFANVYRFYFKETHWRGGNMTAKLKKDIIDLWKLRMLHHRIAETINQRNYSLVLVNPSRHIQSPFLLKFLKPVSFFYLHDPHYRHVYENDFDAHKSLGFGRYLYEKSIKSMRKLLDKQNISCADFLIANSRYTKKKAYQSYKRNSTVCYLGIDKTHFTFSTRKKDIDVLYIGSTENVDNYNLAVKTFSKLKKRVAIRYILTDKEWYDAKKMKGFYQRSRIVLCLTRNEPFGLIPLEAMACGAIPIALDSGGYRETIINKKTGILSQEDSVILERHISFLLSHTRKLDRMKRAARKDIENNWTWDIRIKELESYLLTKIN